MTTRGSRHSIEAFPHVEGGSGLERHRIPVPLCLAGTAAMMNILATILSLMALSVS